MATKPIKKSIDINAPKKKVWEVLLRDEYTRQWYSYFSSGTYAETDWAEGSKAVFKDQSGQGIIGKIAANKPYELLDIEFTGVVDGDKEDYESDMAQGMKGTHEVYRLSEANGVTHLDIAVDMDESYYDMMSAAWDKALIKISELSQ